MLTNVYVKNTALIDEARVEFSPGLNVLTGETGAGKSILITAVGMALGQKASKEMIREGADSALCELTFQVEDEQILQRLKLLEVEPEEGLLTISRRISAGRSVSRINGEMVTQTLVKQAAALLLDIHGQHEHQSLLSRDAQLEFLDEFLGDRVRDVKAGIARQYRSYRSLMKEILELSMDEEQRKRQMDFLTFELEEIENAALRPGEDEELETAYRRMNNAQRITGTLSQVYSLTGYDDGYSAGNQVGRALADLQGIIGYDKELEQLGASLADIDALINDFNREISGYLSELTFSEEDFSEITGRLDQINHLKAKYGRTIRDILRVAEEKQRELEMLENYEAHRAALQKQADREVQALETACRQLSDLRQQGARVFEQQLISQLSQLNFNDVRFSVVFSRTEDYTPRGFDQIEFMISTNPGEPVRSLAGVVSGGELSRIMLGIRTLLASRDHTQTLIFDEIDTGISGRTAQMVARKMALIAGSCQVLCITHLPQIAAMADAHYEICKEVSQGKSFTRVRQLEGEELIGELARMLGGEAITGKVMENALEMKQLADGTKKEMRHG